MILEVAVLDVKPGQSQDFETAFGQAQTILSFMKGYISHQLQKPFGEPWLHLCATAWSKGSPVTLPVPPGRLQLQQGGKTTTSAYQLLWPA